MAVQALTGQYLRDRLQETLPDAVESWNDDALWVDPTRIGEVGRFLKDDPALDFKYLNSISAIDFLEYFEVVYHMMSIIQQHTAVIKTKIYGRENPTLPSVYHLWQGADFQEREIWDLMGVSFDGHPNLKRIMLWEGFEGHPLRKDFL